MKRYFTFRDDKSDKFWSVEVQNSKITVVFGRMGLAGTTTVKILEDEAAAEKDAERLIREKVKKGYVEKAEEQSGQVWGTGILELDRTGEIQSRRHLRTSGNIDRIVE
ncbi:MAG: WGR domain-containing protein [Lewinellaceae bacterium]|nr:WGR domain-containing protein [Lewinellaceae bacterium]